MTLRVVHTLLTSHNLCQRSKNCWTLYFFSKSAKSTPNFLNNHYFWSMLSRQHPSDRTRQRVHHHLIPLKGVFCKISISHFIWKPLDDCAVLCLPSLNYQTGQRRQSSMSQWLILSLSPTFFFFFLSLSALPSPKYDLNLAWRHRAGVIQSGSPQGRTMLISYKRSCNSVSSSPQDSPQSDWASVPSAQTWPVINIPYRAKILLSSLLCYVSQLYKKMRQHICDHCQQTLRVVP